MGHDTVSTAIYKRIPCKKYHRNAATGLRPERCGELAALPTNAGVRSRAVTGNGRKETDTEERRGEGEEQLERGKEEIQCSQLNWFYSVSVHVAGLDRVMSVLQARPADTANATTRPNHTNNRVFHLPQWTSKTGIHKYTACRVGGVDSNVCWQPRTM